MNSILRQLGRRVAKPVLESTLPWAERLTGFRTARGDYLPDRLRILTGRYEAEALDLMRPPLRPGQTIIDVGANVGYTARFFAQAVRRIRDVHAFEPNPVNWLVNRQFSLTYPWDGELRSLSIESLENSSLIPAPKVLRRFSPRG